MEIRRDFYLDKMIRRKHITSGTIKKYLDYFEDSFLIEAAQRYDIMMSIEF